jgi:dTDP-4-dehydrorhamnose reductase
MILVFGKSGQLGHELSVSEKVFAIDRRTANLFYPRSCRDIILESRPSAVINAAAYTAVDLAEGDAETAMTVNGESPGEMARACAELGVPFVHVSTDYVFDGLKSSPWLPNDPTVPATVYGRTKVAGEHAIRNSGAVYAILRTSWVFSHLSGNFVTTMLKIAQSNTNVSVVSDQIGGPTPAIDLANACIEVAEQLIRYPDKQGVFHFSGAPDVSWFEFANAIFEEASLPMKVIPISSDDYPTRAVRPLNSCMDCSLTHEFFNLPRPDWRVRLKSCISQLGARA